MGSIKLRVHPLFFLFGFYYALTGRITIFIVYTITAVVHELGHSFSASSVGYKLNQITLMPFGAVVSGINNEISSKDQIKIALSGPFINLAVGLFFIATWWIFPITYAYTDVVVEANLTLSLINFLPVYPLDGGRVLRALFSSWWGERKGLKICRIISVIFAIFLLSVFILSCFYAFNLSFLFFSLFVLFGAFDSCKENRYVKVYTTLSEENLKRGLTFNKIALDENASIKKLMSLLKTDCVNEVVVFSHGKPSYVLGQTAINELMQNSNIYQTIKSAKRGKIA